MQTATIEIKERTLNTFSKNNLEIFVNSEDFEDLVLWYQMIKWETGEVENFNSFKKTLWL